MNKYELAKYINTTVGMVETNFPLLCSKNLAKGYLITKTGKGETADYTIQQVEPQIVDKKEFSKKRGIDNYSHLSEEELKNEKWITTYCSDLYEVSDLGRVRKKYDKKILQGTIIDGYQYVELDYHRYRMNRIVLQSWQPNPDFPNLTVDHIDGKRGNNRLSNLRWGTDEENTAWMLMNRKEITKETTRLINQYGYDEVLKILQSIK